jgi:hypothetical protein
MEAATLVSLGLYWLPGSSLIAGSLPLTSEDMDLQQQQHILLMIILLQIMIV